VTQNAGLGVDLLSTPLISNDGILNVAGNVTVSPSGPVSSPPFVEQGTTPQTFVPGTWHHGGTTLGLGTALTGSSGSVLVNAVVSTLMGALRPVLDNVDSNIVQPLLTGLGLDLGTADVLPLAVACGQPGLLA
jgi:hypothetical protein